MTLVEPTGRQLPDAEYLTLSSRLIPDLDGGFTIVALSRAQQLAEAGAGGGLGPQMLTFDPGTAADHAAHRQTFVDRGALSDVSRMRNLFDEATDAAGGAASWLRAAADPSLDVAEGIEYRVLSDPEGRPFLALPVIPGDPDWHITQASVRVYDAAGADIGGLVGFGALYRSWLQHVAGQLGDRTIVVICESRQIGELIADWSDPRVRIVHGTHTIHLEPPHTPDAPMNALWTRWFQVADRFDVISWSTPRQRDEVRERFGDAARHVFVPNRIPLPPHHEGLREEGLVVVLGRLAPGKRIDQAITAFVRADVPGTRLEIWGDGAEKQRLQNVIDELGAGDRVVLAGYTDAPDQVLARASLLLTATAFEGQPLSIIEALRSGVPVVSYDVRYGIRDVLVDGGGMLAPREDVDSLAETLRHVLADEGVLERLQREAATAAQAWLPERSRDALVELIHDVVSRPSRRA